MKRDFLFKLIAVSIGIFISIIAIEVVLRVQNLVQLDGFHNETPWHNVFHHGDGSFVVREYGKNCEGGKIKLLLLGDSWMIDEYLVEAEYLSNTIGNEFAESTGKCVQTINGAKSSYSPTLYLLTARQAFNTYGKFDYVIVTIDETDIGDEWLRYRIPTVRDNSGKIIGVSYDNDIESQYIWNGKLWAESSNSYIIRFIKFIFFYRIFEPSLYKFTFAIRPDYSNLMQYVFSPDSSSRFKREIEHFESRLLEMASEISRFTTGAKSVIVTHHPHLRGLVDAIDNGKLYLPIVSESIARLKEKTDISVLDARNYLKQINKNDLLNNTFVPGDPFSHLADAGEIRYGKWIVAQLDPK